VRSAFNGLETETVADARGRLRARTSTLQAGMVISKVDVPLGPGPTLYTRVGDVFSWWCAALSLAIGLRLFSGRRPAAAVQQIAAKRIGSHVPAGSRDGPR